MKVDGAGLSDESLLQTRAGQALTRADWVKGEVTGTRGAGRKRVGFKH